MRKERLELSRVSPLDSKSSASTSSATFARAVRAGRTGTTLPAVRRAVDKYSRLMRGPDAAGVHSTLVSEFAGETLWDNTLSYVTH